MVTQQPQGAGISKWGTSSHARRYTRVPRLLERPRPQDDGHKRLDPLRVRRRRDLPVVTPARRVLPVPGEVGALLPGQRASRGGHRRERWGLSPVDTEMLQASRASARRSTSANTLPALKNGSAYALRNERGRRR